MEAVFGRSIVIGVSILALTACAAKELTESRSDAAMDLQSTADDDSLGQELTFEDASRWQKPLSRAMGQVEDAGDTFQASLNHLYNLLLAADSEVGTAKIDQALQVTIRDYQLFGLESKHLHDRLVAKDAKLALTRHQESAQAYERVVTLLKGIERRPTSVRPYASIRGRLIFEFLREPASHGQGKARGLAPRQRDAVALLDFGRQISHTIVEVHASVSTWTSDARRGGLAVGLSLDNVE